ncbi:hypothetical protein Avbf_15630 [Armadillidium vulgare]|nr:hypothetical protein Avbf_15630 [Armadillidium vulgare]
MDNYLCKIRETILYLQICVRESVQKSVGSFYQINLWRGNGRGFRFRRQILGVFLYFTQNPQEFEKENDLRGKIKNSIQIIKIYCCYLDRVTRSSRNQQPFVQSFHWDSVKRISVLRFEYFASFLNGEILINCLELIYFSIRIFKKLSLKYIYILEKFAPNFYLRKIVVPNFSVIYFWNHLIIPVQTIVQ